MTLRQYVFFFACVAAAWLLLYIGFGRFGQCPPLVEAVAAADLRHKGQLTETIRMYQDQMQTAQHETEPQGEA